MRIDYHEQHYSPDQWFTIIGHSLPHPSADPTRTRDFSIFTPADGYYEPIRLYPFGDPEHYFCSLIKTCQIANGRDSTGRHPARTEAYEDFCNHLEDILRGHLCYWKLIRIELSGEQIRLTYQNTRLRQNQIITWRSGKFLFGLKSTLQRYTPSYRIFLRTSAATRAPEHLNHQSSRHPADQASSADRTPEEPSSVESVSLDGRPALPQAKVIEDLGHTANIIYLYQFSDGSMLGEVTSYTGL